MPRLVDIPDVVWLQLVRIGSNALYIWAEKYVTEVAAVANGATLNKAEQDEMLRQLESILDAEKVDIDRTILELAEVLPGLDTGLSGDHKDRALFKDVRGDAIRSFVQSARLGSPDHYRYYFAFSHPAGSIPDEEVEAFLTLSERQPDQAVQQFAALAEEVRPQGATKAEVLIDRIQSWSERISHRAVPGVFAAFANTMDRIAAAMPPGAFGEHSAWRSAERAVNALLPRIAGEVRDASVRALFETGQSTGWLTSILRSQIFAHGHYGDKPEPEERWLLTQEEFERVMAMMLERYRTTPPTQLMRVPRFLSLLYAWRQAANDAEVSEWVQAQTTTDAGLWPFSRRFGVGRKVVLLEYNSHLGGETFSLY
jgi:hypothetical protein